MGTNGMPRELDVIVIAAGAAGEVAAGRLAERVGDLTVGIPDARVRPAEVRVEVAGAASGVLEVDSDERRLRMVGRLTRPLAQFTGFSI